MPEIFTCESFLNMGPGNLIEERLIHSVIGAFYEVYNDLGFGFLERAYEIALERELKNRSHEVSREVSMIICYKGEPILRQRIDMVVDSRLIIEIKSSESLRSSSTRQVYNYLHATGLEVGLLLHFGPRPWFSRVFCRPSHKHEKHSAHFEPENSLDCEDSSHSEDDNSPDFENSAVHSEDQGVALDVSGSNTNLA